MPDCDRVVHAFTVRPHASPHSECLCLLLLLIPYTAAVLLATDQPIRYLSMIMTAIMVMSFYSVFIVANEMEDPFGTQPNDMPMLAYHEEFCAMLCALITHAWLPEDQWMVASGKWVRPRTIGLVANAFFESIHSSKRVNIESRERPVPHDSLLNRSKYKNRKAQSGGFGWITKIARQGGGKSGTQFPTVVSEGLPGADQEMESMARVIQRASRARNKRLGKLSRMAGSAAKGLTASVASLQDASLNATPEGRRKEAERKQQLLAGESRNPQVRYAPDNVDPFAAEA